MKFSLKTMATASVMMLGAMTAAMPAHALDDRQKEEFGAFIREYLIQNPEIMLEVQDALEKKQQEQVASQASQVIERNHDAIFNSENDIALGNPQGDVTIVEFFDYNCGYCKRALSDMDAILSKDKNVRFVMKELPILGPDSEAAHKISAAVRKIAPEKYGEFHRTLLGSQGRATDATAVAVAAKLGINEADIRKTIADNPNDGDVAKVYQLARNLGVSGTPSYVVGNEAVFGAVGVSQLQEKIANFRACGKGTC